MAFTWLVLSVLFSSSNADIELLECRSPDMPINGGYGPKQDKYYPGDVVQFYCDIDTYIGGNFYRKCMDTGEWSGDTPVCDSPMKFDAVFQTTDIDEASSASAATDGIRTTCTETIGGEREEWWGTFSKGGQLIRVMLFLPRGPANLEIILVKRNGDELVCKKIQKVTDRYEWAIENCPEPNNVDATGLKIRSLTKDPLKICEIQAYVLTSPRCNDPHQTVKNGRFQISRTSAHLVCDGAYSRSPDRKLECIRDGEWNRKPLYCREPDYEDDDYGTGLGPKRGRE